MGDDSLCFENPVEFLETTVIHWLNFVSDEAMVAESAVWSSPFFGFKHVTYMYPIVCRLERPTDATDTSD